MERYTGEGEPPCSCIVVTLKEQLQSKEQAKEQANEQVKEQANEQVKEQAKEQAKDNLNFGVQFHNGTVLSSTNKIKILRVTEQNLNYRLSTPSQGNLLHQKLCTTVFMGTECLVHPLCNEREAKAYTGILFSSSCLHVNLSSCFCFKWNFRFTQVW